MKPTLASRLLLAVSAVLLTLALLGLLELGLRLAGWPHTTPQDRIKTLDSYLLTRNRSNLSIKTFARHVQVTTNRLGFRGRDISLNKGMRVRRIAALGDSTTFGYGVGDQETFSHILEVRLNHESPPDSLRYEVINAGVSGHATVQGLRMFERKVLPYAPDIVLVSYAFNDNDYMHGPYLYGKPLSDISVGPEWQVKLRNLLYHHSSFCRGMIHLINRDRYEKWRLEHASQIRAGELVLVSQNAYQVNLERFIGIGPVARLPGDIRACPGSTQIQSI